MQIDTMAAHESRLHEKQHEPSGKQEPVQVQQKRQRRGLENGSQIKGTRKAGKVD
jgi:hypothetical protein